MSIPISACLIIRAAKGDESSYEQLIHDYTVNMECGHWTTFGCRCDPPCEQPTDEQKDELQRRLTAHFEANPVKMREEPIGMRGYVLTTKMIKRHAYSIWQRDGGEALDNWFKAKKELQDLGCEGKLEEFMGTTCPDCNNVNYKCKCFLPEGSVV